MSDRGFDVDVADGVCRFARPAGPVRFLSTGFDGGVRTSDAAYNVTVPEGWGDEGARDLRAYVEGRAAAAGFAIGSTDPGLLTGVDQRHARVARLGTVTAVSTAGVSNPAALPVAGSARRDAAAHDAVAQDAIARDATDRDDGEGNADRRHPPVGTVNLLVGTTRDLAPGALANLVAVAAEAKAATLLATTGFPGTTSDAIVVGSNPGGEPTEFSGSATAVGANARACVRDALVASLGSRYEDGGVPGSVADAKHGVVTDRRADVSRR
ncbi:adenosylcobinamide amidohydrolase [Halorubrum sp. JWXQ-INN 858]|uniref:adenosylcobinamide amidohydrolase n=1 Tax=Halorubrum sp. JWXQ-INN 858 TaxID=2690782 RepID=UPI001357703D|nr:adenosylcobinamide amidohydrolase [Halorubrum sp. JWXQ-INN 858]MWV65120.1 adenosylcobinamide amidohydrolase [Halorubrum sp. JWXQ-INN 858]